MQRYNERKPFSNFSPQLDVILGKNGNKEKAMEKNARKKSKNNNLKV